MREIKFRLVKNGAIVGYEKHEMRQGLCESAIMHSAESREWANITSYPDKYIDHDCKEQYVGLKDENGREIYEGDILDFDIQDFEGGDHLYTLPVSYLIDVFVCISPETEEIFNLGQIQADDDEFEVIGNIHETPEKLED